MYSTTTAAFMRSGRCLTYMYNNREDLKAIRALFVYIPHPCTVWRRVGSRLGRLNGVLRTMNTRDRDKLYPSMRHAIGLSYSRDGFN